MTLIDIWAQRGLSLTRGTGIHSEELCPLAELSTTRGIQRLSGPSGVEHGLFGVAVNSGSHWASVSLFRDSTGPQLFGRPANCKSFAFCTPFGTRV